MSAFDIRFESLNMVQTLKNKVGAEGPSMVGLRIQWPTPNRSGFESVLSTKLEEGASIIKDGATISDLRLLSLDITNQVDVEILVSSEFTPTKVQAALKKGLSVILKAAFAKVTGGWTTVLAKGADSLGGSLIDELFSADAETVVMGQGKFTLDPGAFQRGTLTIPLTFPEEYKITQRVRVRGGSPGTGVRHRTETVHTYAEGDPNGEITLRIL